MNYLAKIHQTPEQRLAKTSEESADLLEVVSGKLDILNETIKSAEKAKSEPIHINITLDLQ